MTVLSFDVGTRTLSLCVVSPAAASAAVTILDWRILDLHGEDKKLTMHDLSERCVKTLMNIRLMETYRPDTVLIETQRGGTFGNATMVSMSHVLHAFVMTSAHHLGIPCTVVFMSPTRKIVAAVGLLPKEEEEIVADDASQELTTRQKNYKFYKKNKKVSKDAVAFLFRDASRVELSSTLQSAYTNSKKKDDLADSFMQAYAYLNTPPIVTKKRKRGITKKE
jgi:hypothetical protein